MKIWPYISMFLLGALLTLAAAWKWFGGDDYSVEIKKIKNKGTSGPIDIVIDSSPNSSEMDTQTEKEGLLAKWKAKRELKKASKNGNTK